MTTSSVRIHPTAIVDAQAELDTDVIVGPYCIIGPHVKVGKGSILHSHVVIEGHTTLGRENQIFPFASVGTKPQDLKYRGEPTLLLIGDRNQIRENATLQPGTVQGGGKTVVGSDNLFMAYTHVAHDCILGNGNILANGTQLSGHVIIDNNAILGGLTGVHQFCRVGDLAMTGAGAMVAQDLPPFCVGQGDRAVLKGLNLVGMKRRGLSTPEIQAVKAAYKLVFKAGAPTIDAAIQLCVEQGLSSNPQVAAFLEFIKTSKRGVIRPLGDIEVSE